MRTHLALPKIESLLDAHLAESLQYASQAPDIRCLCCPVVSADEAQFLDAMAAFSVGDNTLITDKLSGWLPSGSVERLQARKEEFQSIMQQIGAPIPIRDWDMVYLRNQSHRHRGCAHVNEPPMIH